MTKTIVSGYIPKNAQKVEGTGFTAEYVAGQDEIYAQLDAKQNELYQAYGDESKYNELKEEYDKLREKLYAAKVTSGFMIKFDDMEECNLVAQAWEQDDAVTCVTMGFGRNLMYVTTLNTEGKYFPATFCFIATEFKYDPTQYTFR